MTIPMWYLVVTMGLSYWRVEFTNYFDCVQYQTDYSMKNPLAQVSDCYLISNETQRTVM